MRCSFSVLLLSILVPAAGLAADGVAVPNPLDEACVQNLLGEGWERDKNIVLWEPGDLERIAPAERPLAEMLQDLMTGFGVTRAAEVSYSRTEGGLDNVALRVFLFSGPERADAHRHRKYESERSAPYYERSEEGGDIVFDSNQTNKRIVFRGTLWVTSSQLGDSGLHLQILEQCLASP